MRISVQHGTIYRYPMAVWLNPHTFRLRPRMTTTQKLVQFQMEIVPRPVEVRECLDQDGNLVLWARFHLPTEELSVVTEFAVEMDRDASTGFLMGDESMNLALWYPEPLSAALAGYRNSGAIAQNVSAFAKSVAEVSQWNILNFLEGLSQQMHGTFRHVARPQGPAWLSGETLARGEGSCRDLAVLFCDCCRTVGIAARFVSGYECTSAGRGDSSMHAWAEVYLPNAGWRGYDPSRGMAVTDRHVAVAAAVAPDLAAPVTGTYFGGWESQMKTELRLQAEIGTF